MMVWLLWFLLATTVVADTCPEILQASDTNGDGRLTHFDLEGFLVHLSPFEGCPAVGFGLVTPQIYWDTFEDLECLCEDLVSQDCCGGVKVDSSSTKFTVHVCSTFMSVLEAECGTPTPTAAPVATIVTPSPTGSLVDPGFVFEPEPEPEGQNESGPSTIAVVIPVVVALAILGALLGCWIGGRDSGSPSSIAKGRFYDFGHVDMSTTEETAENVLETLEAVVDDESLSENVDVFTDACDVESGFDTARHLEAARRLADGECSQASTADEDYKSAKSHLSPQKSPRKPSPKRPLRIVLFQ